MMFSGTMTMLCIFAALICASVRAITVDITPRNEVVVTEGDSLRILCNAGVPIEHCSVQIPSYAGRIMLKENQTRTDGLLYFGAGFRYGQCGVEIKHVRKEYDGLFECNLIAAGAGEEISATTKIIIATAKVDINHPNEVVVKEGDSLRILCNAGVPIELCSVLIPSYAGRIMLKENQTRIDGLLYFGEGFRKGQCGVEIKHVRKEYDGLFECKLLASDAVEEISATTKIVVAKKPDDPELILSPGQDGQYNYTAGEKIDISCRAASGRPPANLSLYIDDELIPTNYRVSAYNGNDIKAEANASGTLIWTDNGKALRCVSKHPTLDQHAKSVTRQLSVQYAPQHQIPIELHNITIGQQLTINITVNANPQPEFTWNVWNEGPTQITAGRSCDNDRIQTDLPKNLGNDSYLLNLKIVTVEKEDIDKRVILEAKNLLGTHYYVFTLWGLKPRPPQVSVDITPKNEILVEEGGSFDIICNANLEITICIVNLPTQRLLLLNSTIPEKNGIKYHGAGYKSGQCGARIRNVPLEYDGEFQCDVAILNRSSLWSAKTNIAVTVKVDITPKNDILVEEGGSLDIVCNVSRKIQSCIVSIPSVGFITLNPDAGEKHGISYHGAGFESGQCGVRISNVSFQYKGEFQCLVGFSNIQRLGSAKANIVVKEKKIRREENRWVPN